MTTFVLVKTVGEAEEDIKSHTPTQFIESFVDLTQEQDSTELPGSRNSKDSIFEQQVLLEFQHFIGSNREQIENLPQLCGCGLLLL